MSHVQVPAEDGPVVFVSDSIEGVLPAQQDVMHSNTCADLCWHMLDGLILPDGMLRH